MSLNKRIIRRASSSSSACSSPEVRCACQFYDSVSPLPERTARLDATTPHRRQYTSRCRRGIAESPSMLLSSSRQQLTPGYGRIVYDTNPAGRWWVKTKTLCVRFCESAESAAYRIRSRSHGVSGQACFTKLRGERGISKVSRLSLLTAHVQPAPFYISQTSRIIDPVCGTFFASSYALRAFFPNRFQYNFFSNRLGLKNLARHQVGKKVINIVHTVSVRLRF